MIPLCYKRQLFRRVTTTELGGTLPPHQPSKQDSSETKEENYPPSDKCVALMVNYLIASKKLPYLL